MNIRFGKCILANIALCGALVNACGISSQTMKSVTSDIAPIDPNPITKPSTPEEQPSNNLEWKIMKAYPYVISFPIADASDWSDTSVLKSEDLGMTQYIVNKYYGMLDGKFVRSFFFAILDFDNMNCNKTDEYLAHAASSFSTRVQAYSSEDRKKNAKYIIANKVSHIEASTTIKGYITVTDIQKCFAFEMGQVTSDIQNFKSLDLKEQSIFGEIVRKTVFGVDIIK